MQAHVQFLKLELEDTQMAAKTLSEMSRQEQQRARELGSLEQKDAAFIRDIGQIKDLLDPIKKRVQEVSILNFVGGYEAETIAPPAVGTKIYPKPTLIFSLAAFLGLLAGFGLAYLAELADHSFRTPEEIRRYLSLPVVGHIPFFRLKDQEGAQAAAGDTGLDPVLYTVYHPKSQEAESFRGVRTSLFFSTRSEGFKVIQVTSPDTGDGKTTLAANLAVSIAQSAKKVLLIDADFRRPRIHKLFNIHTQQGLTSVIAGEAEPDNVIQPTAIPGLFALPCGPIPQNPAELLTLSHFGKVLAVLREKFDYVIIDTPPLLAVTDPCMVAPYVDAVMLTVRISKNVKPHASRAKEILATLGAKVLGVVVNGVGPDGGAYGYNNYRYGYTYKSYNYYYNHYQNDSYYTSDGNDDANTAANSEQAQPNKPRRSRSRRRKNLFTWLFNR